jgi:hypothetical protein
MQPLSRRTLLRGFGSALALPLLDAMLPARVALGRGPAPVRRLAWVYVPNGVHLPNWFPSEEGRLRQELPATLAPLADLRREFSVLGGLTADKARANGDGPGDHARACAAFLTGVQPLKTDGQVGLGISADQIAADAIGGQTRFRSLELGCERGGTSGQCDSGYSCAYSSNLSWRSASQWTGKETSPRRAFDRLFRGGLDGPTAARLAERERRRRSLLDFVAADAQKLRSRLGAADRAKLGEYFDGLREVERRIEAFESARVDAVPDAARPGQRPADFAEHVALQYEILALAFETDVTRVATFLVANEGSNRAYREVGVREGHHQLSHHGRDAAKQEQIQRIDRFQLERFSAFLERLAATPAEGGSLLDASMIVYGSGIGDGDRHNHEHLPVLLAGRGGGALTPGAYTRFPDDTPVNDLHLALLQRAGVDAAPFGDGRGPLVGI